MENKLNILLRNDFNIGYYLDELSEINDGHKLLVSTEDLSNLNIEQLKQLITILKETQ